MKSDPINPTHYRSHPSGIECIQITEHMSFLLGNVVKYVWRADLKNGIQDLEKARWYLEREIKKRMAGGEKRTLSGAVQSNERGEGLPHHNAGRGDALRDDEGRSRGGAKELQRAWRLGGLDFALPEWGILPTTINEGKQ